MGKEHEQECGNGVIEEETKKKKGLALLIHDLKQKELIPLKILFFLLLAGECIFLI